LLILNFKKKFMEKYFYIYNDDYIIKHIHLSRPSKLWAANTPIHLRQHITPTDTPGLEILSNYHKQQ